jgi:hypothetical protein
VADLVAEYGPDGVDLGATVSLATPHNRQLLGTVNLNKAGDLRGTASIVGQYANAAVTFSAQGATFQSSLAHTFTSGRAVTAKLSVDEKKQLEATADFVGKFVTAHATLGEDGPTLLVTASGSTPQRRLIAGRVELRPGNEIAAAVDLIGRFGHLTAEASNQGYALGLEVDHVTPRGRRLVGSAAYKNGQFEGGVELTGKLGQYRATYSPGNGTAVSVNLGTDALSLCASAQVDSPGTVRDLIIGFRKRFDLPSGSTVAVSGSLNRPGADEHPSCFNYNVEYANLNGLVATISRNPGRGDLSATIGGRDLDAGVIVDNGHVVGGQVNWRPTDGVTVTGTVRDGETEARINVNRRF